MLATLIAVPATNVQAATAYGVRAFDFEAGFGPGIPPPEPSPIAFSDHFNNNNPLTGAMKTLGAATSAAGYSVFNNGFSAGVETLPGDVFTARYGVGRLELRASDGKDSPNNLTPAGMLNLSNRLTVADVAGSSLLTRTSSFEARAYYDFVTPDASSYYGLRLSDNPGAGGDYNDLLDLRVTRGGDDKPKLNLRLLSSVGGVLTSTSLRTYDLTTVMANHGKTLADLGVIGFEFHYNYFGEANSSNGVLATFDLLDTAGNDLFRVTVGDGVNPTITPLFRGEEFTRASVGATWTLAPVPEPATYALMAMGLAVVGVAGRRQRKSA